MHKKWNILSERIRDSKTILLSTHMNPDCDGLGSEIAFYYYLESLGKEVKIVNITSMNKNYQFLNEESSIETYDGLLHDKWLKIVDLAIIFDIGHYKRLGEIADKINQYNIYSISIDHHLSDNSFFDYSIVDVKAAATGLLVWKYFKYKKIDVFSLNIANGLYAALISDTGSFRYNSTSPDCHEMAKDLLNSGVLPYGIYSAIYEQREIKQVKLFSYLIENVNFYDNIFACSKISLKVLNKFNCTMEDVDGLSDYLRSIKGVEVAFVISETSNSVFKISFRSRGKYIINDVAEDCGGGGHKFAAGAIVKDRPIEEIEKKIIKKLNKKIKEVHVD